MGKNIMALVEGKHLRIIAVFFAVLFIVGISVFMDYGLSYDEARNWGFGNSVYSHVLTGTNVLEKYESHEKTHGPTFEFTLAALEKGLGINNGKDLYFMRHLATFLMSYIGIVFFYLLCTHLFKDWKLGLLGCLFLTLTPRIFAHSFYNSVDLPLMTLFIISFYTLIRYLNRKSLRRAAVHALACAILIDIRVIGAIVPLFTLLFIGWESIGFKKNKKEIIKIGKSLLIYLSLLIFFTILLWPLLWGNPLGNALAAVGEISNDPMQGNVLYIGQYIKATEVPWHYTPVWIAITTPVLYLALFAAGIFFSAKSLLKKSKKRMLERRETLLILLWFFLPITAAGAMGSTLFDGWRHLYFIYPAFLIISLAGLAGLFRIIKTKFKGKRKKVLTIALILIIAVGLFDTAFFMAKNHPYENVYFNVFAGKDMEEIKNNFDLDYGGNSYRQAIEYILENNPNRIIIVRFATWPGQLNLRPLPKEDLERIKFTNSDNWEFFLSNYRWHKEEYPFPEYYSIMVNGTKIMGVYKQNNVKQQC